MRGGAVLRLRDARIWVCAAVVVAALWRARTELEGASGTTILAWAVLTFVGSILVGAFGWALDPHGVLPRSLAFVGFSWGAACSVLAAQTGRDSHQLLVKWFGAGNGALAARWLGEPLISDMLAMLGVLLVLALARGHASRPTDGVKIGMGCGFGIWSGELLVALAHGVVDNPAGSLADGLPHWFTLVAAPWAAAAAAGYGFSVALMGIGGRKRRRVGAFVGAVLLSLAVACVVQGVAGAALDAERGGWLWVWADTAGFGLAFAVLLPKRSPRWWATLSCAGLGVIALAISLCPWPYAVLVLLSPLALVAFWHKATRAEGAWLVGALADEEGAVRADCVDAAEMIDLTARRSRAQTARDAFGPKARSLGVRLRGGQIRLANAKALLAVEREAAGPKPDSQWRTWLAHLDDEVVAQREAIRAAVTDMAKEEGVYQ